ncbi:MAG: hypothetical protein ACPGQV_10520 [Alphaproteobacteria bacterium]
MTRTAYSLGRHKAVLVACQLICAVVLSGQVLAASEKMGDVFGAVLKLNAQIPGDARTSKSLGTAREGHAVVIDSDGLVVTIGYLTLEAEAVTLMTNDGEKYRRKFWPTTTIPVLGSFERCSR